MNDKLIIISAPSGSGKSTVIGHLMMAGLNLEFSVSATSRSMRSGEVNGREYYFITADEFREKISKGELLEWQEVYPGSYYGTPLSEPDRIHASGHIPIFDLDVVGGVNVKHMFGSRALSIFIQPPSFEVLEQRLRTRNTDSEESLRKRIEKARWELDFAPKFDRVVINDQLQAALQEVENIIRTFLQN